MKIAYLVNQYPKVSHSFIRREIAGLEATGIQVIRFSIRACAEELIDPADKAELEKTRIVLDEGTASLFLSLLQVALTRPIAFLRALRLALSIGWGSDRGVLRHLAYLAEACLSLRWFSAIDIAHAHAHFGTNPAAVLMLCHRLGGPNYSFTVHGPEEFDKASSISLSEKIKRASFVVAVSSFGRSQLYRWCDYTQWSKIHVIRCGVDHHFLNQQLAPIPNTPTLVCVGRLCEQKGQLLLIEAASQLAAEDLPFKLILVGEGPLRPQIETLIQHHGLENQVKITGWVSGDAVQKYIIDSRVLVLPSFAEGLPVVIMESLALGRPVISTYVAGISELVESDVNGWLIPAGSVEVLTKAMRTVLKMPIESLEKIGKLGTEHVAQNHNAIAEAKKLATLFQSDGKSCLETVEKVR